MGILKMYRCRDCELEFSDLPEDATFAEVGDIDPATGKLKNPKPIPQECPDCGGMNTEPVMEDGRHKNA